VQNAQTDVAYYQLGIQRQAELASRAVASQARLDQARHAMIAYTDDYKFMMLIALAAMPIVFLLRKGGSQADAGHPVLE
jgi:multidrug resistance efflux pump